jgi:putative hydrolase of the HAD superfamily
MAGRVGMRLKVFVDVDGVIIDGWHSIPERRKPWDATIEQDIGINREALHRALFKPRGAGTPNLFSSCARGESDLQVLLAEILPGLGYLGSVETFLTYWFSKDSNVNQDVLNFIQTLQKHGAIDLYLATNKERHRADYLWNTVGLKAFFTDMFSSARLGIMKEDVDYFAQINTRLNFSNDEKPLFFDDSENVVMTARAAGWDAHVFDSIETLSGNPRLRTFLDSGHV